MGCPPSGEARGLQCRSCAASWSGGRNGVGSNGPQVRRVWLAWSGSGTGRASLPPRPRPRPPPPRPTVQLRTPVLPLLSVPGEQRGHRDPQCRQGGQERTGGPHPARAGLLLPRGELCCRPQGPKVGIGRGTVPPTSTPGRSKAGARPQGLCGAAASHLFPRRSTQGGWVEKAHGRGPLPGAAGTRAAEAPGLGGAPRRVLALRRAWDLGRRVLQAATPHTPRGCRV